MREFRAYCHSFGAINRLGIHNPDATIPWGEEQLGPEDISRKQVLDRIHAGFGKLSLPDKLTFSATALALTSLPNLPEKETGIVVGLPYGSASTDLRYIESMLTGFPSPALFSATLPSSALAEITIFFKIRGPNRVISEGKMTGIATLDHACRLLRLGKADRVVAVITYAVDPSDRDSALLGKEGAPPNSSYAFVLGTTPLREPDDLHLEGTWNEHGETEESVSDDVYFNDVIQHLGSRTNGSVHFRPGHMGLIKIVKDT